MKQEQKPFEIKEEFRDLSVDEIIRLCGKCGDWDSMTVLHLIAYIKKSNAEIRRLQSELKRKSEACIHFAKANQYFMEANMELQQQLADAPTWGEWVDANKKGFDKCNPGVYQLDIDDECVFAMRDYNGGWSYEKNFECSPNRFRRLNYEPQPAREVEPPEKKYNLLGHHVTVAEMAEWRGDPDLNMPNIGELARDFLAVQAELRELKGKR